MNQASDILERQYKDASNLNARIALHTRFSVNPEPWWEWVFRMMRLPAKARILEVGTGPADIWRANLDHMPSGWEITLSDFSPGMIEQARQNLGEARHRFTFARINVMDIPFPEGHFDGVLAHFMLYHAPDPARALAELHRVLKPGGRLYAATNGARHMKQFWELARQSDAQAAIVTGATFFGLENGVELLHRQFPTVNRYLYDDALRVTEVEPLVAYFESIYHTPEQRRHIAPFRTAVQQVIQQEGELFIEKHSGLFEAIKS